MLARKLVVVVESLGEWIRFSLLPVVTDVYLGKVVVLLKPRNSAGSGRRERDIEEGIKTADGEDGCVEDDVPEEREPKYICSCELAPVLWGMNRMDVPPTLCKYDAPGCSGSRPSMLRISLPGW